LAFRRRLDRETWSFVLEGSAPRWRAGRRVAFQRIDDWVAPTWPGGSHPQQFHLDFSVGDIDAAEPSVSPSGAPARPPAIDGRRIQVYLDPAGHPSA